MHLWKHGNACKVPVRDNPHWRMRSVVVRKLQKRASFQIFTNRGQFAAQKIQSNSCASTTFRTSQLSVS